MGETFAQSATSLGVLRSILDNYPYSVGLFREILQNSDDAGATTQTYVLDRRTHSTDSLSDGLAKAQGPAFLAHNDAQFNEANWRSIQAVYESSKNLDSSKIGKYGVGFRSVFHITDCPQIVSGDTFAMFDPLQSYTSSGGMKASLSAVPSAQLAPFSYFMDSQTTSFDGTIIRCPLRSLVGKISKNVVTPDSLAQLFREFIDKEAGIALLFLRHIKKIVVYDISAEGVSTCLLDLSISRSTSVSFGEHGMTSMATVSVAGGETNIWRILLVKYEQEDAAKALSSENSETFLGEHKLLPHIGIAALADGRKTQGHLFTFLPLPLLTGFPLHIHAYFSLTQSRQHLRNSQETGLTEGTDDYLMIEWNKLLFERYIPDAWRIFLEIMAGDATTNSNIFDMWPPQQPASAENVYWKALPMNLFTSITSSRSAVWPIAQNDSSAPATYQALDSLITAPRHDRFLRALISAGLKFTCPPSHIFDIIIASKQFRIHSPEEAHNGLLECTTYLQSATKDDLDCILEYLLSTKHVLNVVNLPLFRVGDDSVIALTKAEGERTTAYVMLNSKEFGIFAGCDGHAIALHQLPEGVADLLRSEGPKSLNIAELTVDRAAAYLAAFPQKMQVDLSKAQVDVHIANWLSNFWVWMDTYSHKEELLKRIRPLYLLPSMTGLRTAETPLFISEAEHPNLRKALASLGAPFMVTSLVPSVQRVLRSSGLLESFSNIPALLSALRDLDNISSHTAIPEDQCTTVLKHIGHHLSGSLSAEAAVRLRRLPVFPVVKQDLKAPFTSPAIIREWTNLADATKIYSVNNPPLLPMVDGAVFVQLGKYAPHLVRHLENATSLSDATLLEMIIDHFGSQTPYIQVIALRHVVQRQRDVPPRVLDKLRNAPIVKARDGSTRKPSDLFAPEAAVSRLFLDDPTRQAEVSNDMDKEITRCLTSLKLLQYRLTLDIVREVISKVGRQPLRPESLDLSRELLKILCSTDLDLSSLKVDFDVAWLPTDQGLRSVQGCRDRSHSPDLFNRVLAVIEEAVVIPLPLVKAFGWDRPVPVDILVRQLEAVIKEAHNGFSVVLNVLNELGRRQLADTDINSILPVVANHRWVPTVDRQLSRSGDAVFQQPESGSGFIQICPMEDATKELLQRLGCSECPTFDEIVEKLRALAQHPLSDQSTSTAFSLLRSIRGKLDMEQGQRLLIPNTCNSLSPLPDTFYNDIGERSKLITLRGKFIAHPSFDEALSASLGLTRLGLAYSRLVAVPDVDMIQPPVVTVRNTLKQYTDKPFATEFFANASDAGARTFTLLSNNFVPQVDDGRCMSPTMAKFASCPSLVVYNDAMFQEKDFEGICRIGVGGKQLEHDKIGKFGLGALTMFSWAELAIVISGEYVVFLNPSRHHLPLQGRAAVMMPLQHVREFYPDQLLAIDDLFGFSIQSDEPYNGSMFYLPLRMDSHVDGLRDPIFRRPCTPEVVVKMIKTFSESAPSCVLFTQLRLVQGIVRDATGSQKEMWKYSVTRDPPDIIGGYSAESVTIEGTAGEAESWLVVRVTIHDQDVPEMCRIATSNMHTAGLAISRDNPSFARRKSYNFFSTLPLPLSTTLPLHVMGSFLLSADRRSIQLDKYGDRMTLYNQWLLSDVIPRLYLFLLEHLAEDEVESGPWWPAYHDEDDDKTRAIIESFYTNHLLSSERRVFRTIYGEPRTITPEGVVLHGDEPDVIRDTVLPALKCPNIADLPSGARRLAINVALLHAVRPAFVYDEIRKNPSSIQSLEVKIINGVIRYLSLPEDPTFLLGLPILPLRDGSFATFEQKEVATQTFYLWNPSRREFETNFPSNKFVHSDLKTSDLLKMSVNVSPLNPEAMKQFIAEEFNRLSSLSTRQQSDWVYDFWHSWPEYHKLGLREEHIAEFPLVPQIDGKTLVSLQQCRNGSAVLVDKSSEEAESLRLCLSKLSLRVVRPDGEPTPQGLIAILTEHNYPVLTFDGLLQALSEHRDLSSISQTIEDFDESLQTIFASWARRMLVDTSNYSDHWLQIARSLPIWPSAGGSSSSILRQASDLRMLPAGLRLDAIGRFMSVPVGEHGILGLLRGPSLQYDEVEEFLEPPEVLQSEDLNAYKSVLSSWIPLLQPPYTQNIRVPDGRGHLVGAETLYAREGLFQQTFGDDVEKFVHPIFSDLEVLLARHGLRKESNMNMSTFRICAEYINSRQDEDLVPRAEALFHAYSFHLPLRVEPHEQGMWAELDGVSFVPRNAAGTRQLPDAANSSGLDIPEEITSLPAVVPPMELVRAEYEPVAWSQRGMFKNQPDRRVIMVHPSLGKPTLLQVVNHLIFLSKMRELSRPQRSTLVHDLKATYAYLDANLSASDNADALALIQDEKIFLNVDSDDPSTLSSGWEWESADCIVFEIAETEEAYARPVRKFLQPYENLLQLCGVLRQYHPRYTGPPPTTSEMNRLRSLRSEFNRMREENVLVDVVFVPADEQALGSIDATSTENVVLPPIVAHRAFLAASTEKFAAQFRPGFIDGMMTSLDNRVEVPVREYSRSSVKLAIEFMYTGEHSAWDAPIDVLLHILLFASFWAVEDLFQDIQRVVVERRLIDPVTLDTIHEVADQVQAEALLASCEEYRTKNAEFISRYLRATEEDV